MTKTEIPSSYSWTCSNCGAINNTSSFGDCGGCGKPAPKSKPSPHGPLYTFDEATKIITTDRGRIYGHPADDFAKVAKMIEALPEFSDPRFKHIAYIICVKLARLAETPDHVDSLIDIAGYARCWAMILDREKQG